MDVSVVTVSFNTKELLLECLHSLKRGLKNLKSEIFVVDNDSRDGTVEAVRSNFAKVKLIANSKNVGFSKANNQAIKKATGKYILVLNPDTRVMPEAIKTMIKYMEKDDNIACATCRVELPDGNLDRDCRRRFPTPWRAFCHFSKLSGIFKGSKIFDQYQMGYLPQNQEHEVDSCVGAFMLVRSSAIKKVGLFDEDFFFYGEDLDWCWRFKEAGYKIMYNPQVKIIHYKGAASGMKETSKHLTKASKEIKRRALYESIHAMELFYKKHYLSQYPFFVNWLVLLSLKVLEKIRVWSV